jgi:hypothetical protein
MLKLPFAGSDCNSRVWFETPHHSQRHKHPTHNPGLLQGHALLPGDASPSHPSAGLYVPQKPMYTPSKTHRAVTLKDGFDRHAWQTAAAVAVHAAFLDPLRRSCSLYCSSQVPPSLCSRIGIMCVYYR